MDALSVAASSVAVRPVTENDLPDQIRAGSQPAGPAGARAVGVDDRVQVEQQRPAFRDVGEGTSDALGAGAVHHGTGQHVLGVDELVRLLREDGIGFVVYKCELTFKQGAVFGDTIEIRQIFEAEDIRALAHPVLRHRIVPNFYAESERVTSDDIIARLIETVPAP